MSVVSAISVQSVRLRRRSARWITVAFVAGVAAMVFGAGAIAESLNWLVLDPFEYAIVAKRQALREGLFTVAPHRVRVLALGDSRLTAGFYPAAFDAATGGRTTSINMALPSHDISRSLYELQDYTWRYGAPEIVVLEMRPTIGIAIEHPLGATGIELAQAYVHDPSSKRLLAFAHGVFPAWYTTHVFGGGWPALDTVQHPRRLYRERRKPVDEIVRMNGVWWWGDRHAALPDDYREPVDHPDVPPAADMDEPLEPWFERFFQYTESHGIKVLLVTAPWRPGAVARRPARPAYMTAALTRHSGVYQYPDGWQVKFYPPHDFFNGGHLNEAGAREYSAEIARELMAAVPDALTPRR